MTKKEETISLLLLIGLLIIPGMASAASSYLPVLKSFIPSVEGFSAKPIWDYKQWSWGYGTAAGYDQAHKPPGTITREQAWKEALKVINSHYNQLSPLIDIALKPQQMAALLSFSYNTGPANAKNIIQTINTGSTADVVTRMKKYIYAGGKVNQGLVNRRKKETDLYQS